MGISIPGLSEALEKLDTTSEQMVALVAGIERVIELLEEQNEIMRSGVVIRH